MAPFFAQVSNFMNTMRVLVLNCGSSSVKFALFHQQNSLPEISGYIENIGAPLARLKLCQGSERRDLEVDGKNHESAIFSVVEHLRNCGILRDGLHAVGHRIVHGGERFRESTLLNEEIIEAVRACNHLAPLHNPANLLGVEISKSLFPDVPQVGVFDTAFHQTMPQEAFLYPLPMTLYREHGVRRYGFHGTSHRFVSQQASVLLGRNILNTCLITAHLGNGCSATAIAYGKSVDTTMGMTPLEGLVMGTRSGTIDPGIPGYLHETLGYNFRRINQLLNRESGLLGLSELSQDMRAITKSAQEGNLQAALAIRIFCHRLAGAIGALATSLPRLDALVFTGGIGENSALIRKLTMEHLAIFSMVCNDDANNVHGAGYNGIITASHCPIPAMVVSTNEEWLIAQDAIQVICTKLTTSQPRLQT